MISKTIKFDCFTKIYNNNLFTRLKNIYTLMYLNNSEFKCKKFKELFCTDVSVK